MLLLLLYTFQEGRPTDSDEGREVVQWRHLHVPSTFETSVHKLTVYEDWTGCSRRRDLGDLLLGGLIVTVYFFSSGSYIPFSLVVLFKRGRGVCPGGPTQTSIGEVFSLSIEIQIMVASEPVLADALPYLSNSGII